MLTKIVSSKTFERKLRWMATRSSLLRNAYHLHHGINLTTLPITKQTPDLALESAQQSLEKVRQATAEPYSFQEIPAKIWIYWHAPIDEAPDVVRRSLASWQKLNPDYECVFLTDDNLQEKLGFDFNSIFKLMSVNLNKAIRADILRLYLLSRYGGIWADSTTFCLSPLTQWLPSETDKTGLFMFRHETNKTRPLEVWFIAAQKAHPVVTKTLEVFLDVLTYPRPLALAVSNKIKRLGVNDQHPTRFTATIVRQAEKKGFMPYFSFSYLLNEVLQQSPDLQNAIDALDNNHSINNSSYEKFITSLVSKQTYKSDYQSSTIYKERVEYLNQLLQSGPNG